MQGRAEELLRACAEGEPEAGNEAAAAGRRVKSEEGRRGRDGDGPAGGSGVGGSTVGHKGPGAERAGSGVMARLPPHQPVPTLATSRVDGAGAARVGGVPVAPASARAGGSGRRSRGVGMNSAR